MREDIIFDGYIELDYNGSLQTIQIYGPTHQFGRYYYDVFIDDEVADDVGDRDELVSEYGSKFYHTVADFKADKALSIDDVWPE